MVDNIDIELYTQKSEITTSEPDITIEITGLVQLNSFIGLDDTPTYYENGKFFKVVDNKIVYTDIELKDLKGKIEDNPELQAEITKQVGESTDKLVQTAISKAINLHDGDINAHQSIQNTIAQNFETLNNKIDLNQIDTETKFTEVDKKIGDNKNYITGVDEYSKEVNKKLEDLTLEVDVDIKGDINQLREDLTNTNEVIQNNYATLDKKIDDTKSNLTESITQLTTVVNDNYTTLDSKIDGVQNNLDTTNQTVADNYTALDTKINTTKAELAKDVSDKYTALDTRVSANTKDITDLTQTVQNDYKEVNGHITDLYNKKVDKVEGKELSTNDFTNELKTKLENIETTAQVNIIESISVDGVPQTVDGNKNVDLHQPVYTLIEKDTPADTNIKEYNLTIDGSTTGVTIEIPKDVYIEKCTLKYVTTVDIPYTGAKVNDAYLQFDRVNSTPIYTPIPELQIHAGQDITIDKNNTISTVIPIPRKISELNNDNYTVTDENYVHTDNNFTDGYIGRIEDLEATTVKNVEYNKITQKITVTFGDTTTKILTLEELLTGASYDGDTGNFTFTRANGEPVVVNTPKENFLSDVQYDGVTKVITFTMSSGATFEVNVSDLIDIYTVKSTNSVNMSIENGNEISSNVKVSATDGNIISVKTDGMYAKHQDISHLATKNEVNTGLATKVDTTTFTNELAKKADKTDVETELAKKVNIATYTTGLATKVDKVEGKSLIENTEIERLKTLKNYDDTQIKTDIININSVLETKVNTTDLENGLKTKQNKLTFDTTPTANSSNPVTSNGIKNELDKKVNSNTLTTELAKKQNKLTAGTGIKIEGDVISNTQTSAEWGNIQGNITAQKDLQNALNTKADTTTVNTKLDKKVDKVEGKSLLLNTEITRLAGLKNYDDTALKKSVSDLSTTVTTLDGKIIDVETEVTDLSGRVTANEADIMSKADKIALDTKQDKLVSGTNIKTINNESLLGEGNIEVKLGGSGVEICDIGTALYIDETKGLRRYLNGQIVDINNNTQAFLNRLKDITALHPSLLCTEENWQAERTLSKFRQVGKFVFNYSGDEIVSVRIPAIVNVQGLFDLQNLGMTVRESLPNIKGGYTTTADISGGISNATGAFNGSSITTTSNYGGGSGKLNDTKVVFNAHNSSPTYQDNAQVQQEAIQYPYFIQIATGSETENNIINEIELNNPYSLFDSKYSDHKLNNLSWLKSAGQWNAKAVYPAAYDELLREYNSPDRLATFNKDAFTVVGSPTITGGGITSGFSESNYLKTIKLSQLQNKSWSINAKWINQGVVAENVLFDFNGWMAWGCILFASNTNQISFSARTGTSTDANNEERWCIKQLGYTPDYIIATMSFDINTGTYTAKADWGEGEQVLGTYTPTTENKQLYYINEAPDNTVNIGTGSEGTYNKNAIDLKQFSITVDGVKVFSGAKSKVKLSTETYTDYDFVLNTSDETFRLPLLNGSEDLPSDRYENLELLASGTTYIAPANGLYALLKISTGAEYIHLANRTARFNIEQRVAGSGQGLSGYLPVKKGDNVYVKYTAGGATSFFRFIYAQGNGTLYYYVGETVQNPNLIDAGRINEQLSGLVEVGGSLGMPSNKYVNLTLGASGDSYTAPANGYYAMYKSASTGQYIIFETNYCKLSSVSAPTNNFVSLLMPVKKGDVVKCIYTASGTTNLFRFIYAQGDV